MGYYHDSGNYAYEAERDAYREAQYASRGAAGGCSHSYIADRNGGGVCSWCGDGVSASEL